MRSIRTILLLPVTFLLLLEVASAETRLTLCNVSQDILKVVVLYQNSPTYPAEESWKVYGWGDFPPGCRGVVRHVTVMDAYLSVSEKRKDGRKTIMHFELKDDAGTQSLRTGSLPTERFFCVSDEPFDRTLRTLDEHEQCPDGWYSQLFNVFIRVQRNANLSLTLGNVDREATPSAGNGGDDGTSSKVLPDPPKGTSTSAVNLPPASLHASSPGSRSVPAERKEGASEGEVAVSRPTVVPGTSQSVRLVPSLEGLYDVRGTNPNGSRYSGTCRVTKVGENRYRFLWSVGSTHSGTGTVDGNVVTVEWGSDSPVIYNVQADGKLVGTWAKGRATDILSPRN